VTGLQQEAANGAPPLIRGAIRIGGEPPVRFQIVAQEQTDRYLGVPKIEREEHGRSYRE
jgi:hypothetical protein